MGHPGRGVSFVITVYNKRPFLPLVIEGLMRQRGSFPREFIFVDDGSTDGSVEFLQEVARARPEMQLIAQANRGPSRALNRGLAEVRMGYVKALDGDDVMCPDATERLLGLLDDECRLAYGHGAHYAEIPASLDPLLSQLPPEGPVPVDRIDEHLRLSLEKSQMAPSCWLADSALVRDCGGCDENIFIQDYSIELRMVSKTRVARLDYPVYFLKQTLDAQRLSSDLRQTLADANAAVAHFFEENPQFLARYGWFAAQRVTGRAWLWAVRHGGKSIFSGEYRRFVQGRLKIGTPLQLMKESCDSFGDALRR